MENRRIRMAAVPLLIAAVLVGGCRGDAADTRGGGDGDSLRTGSAYSRGDDSVGVAGTVSGDVLTAPPLLGPVRLELNRMSTAPEAWADTNRTAHKFLMADLVAAMQSDMKRLGISDTEELQSLADSVMNQLGGGTGHAEGPDPDAVPGYVAEVERLIALYQAKVQAAGGSREPAPAP